VRLPGASGKNPLIGVVQATGSAGGPDFLYLLAAVSICILLILFSQNK
jgi:hypothetical protein